MALLEQRISVDCELDTCGLFCPEPVMLLHNTVQAMASGEVVRVVATDPSTRRDIPRFCRFLNHTLLAQEERGQRFYYLIRKNLFRIDCKPPIRC